MLRIFSDELRDEAVNAVEERRPFEEHIRAVSRNDTYPMIPTELQRRWIDVLFSIDSVEPYEISASIGTFPQHRCRYLPGSHEKYCLDWGADIGDVGIAWMSVDLLGGGIDRDHFIATPQQLTVKVSAKVFRIA